MAPRCANQKRPVHFAPFQRWQAAQAASAAAAGAYRTPGDHGLSGQGGGGQPGGYDGGSSSGSFDGRSALISNGVVGGVLSHLSMMRHAGASRVGSYDEHQEL